jgi:hypothetical protein
MFGYFGHLIQGILTTVVLVILGLTGYVAYNNYMASAYTPEKIVSDYVGILSNPSVENLTNSERDTLNKIMETDTIAGWIRENEFKIKALRRLKDGKEIAVGKIQYTGSDKEYATVVLTLKSQTKKELSEIKLYMQRSGDFWSGQRWKIYQVDMPKTADLVDELKEKGQDILDNLKEKGQDLLQNPTQIWEQK